MGGHDIPDLGRAKAIAFGLALVVAAVAALVCGRMPGVESSPAPAPSAPPSSSPAAALPSTDRPTDPQPPLAAGAGPASRPPPAPAPDAPAPEAPAPPPAAARGSVLVEGGDSRSALSVLPEPVGSLDREAIRTAIAAIKPKIAECYEAALAHDPDLSGRVTVDFTIEAVDGGGGVTAGEVNQTDMNAPFFEACVLKQVVDVPFAAPAGGGVVKVRYPFTFASQGD